MFGKGQQLADETWPLLALFLSCAPSTTTSTLGGNIVLTDDDQNVIVRYEYDVFGAVRSETGTSDNTRKFTGKEYESDVKLYYFAARYYDPYVGRFISRDPAGDGLNWYVYTNNNPLKYTDPNGLEPVQEGAAGVDEFVGYLANNKPQNLSDYKPILKRDGWKPVQDYIRFDDDKPRYIATDKYGWVDMQHFMASAAETVYQLRTTHPKAAHNIALLKGEWTEGYQLAMAPNSAFSYEDLPSNDAGADFGAYHYDPNGAPLAEQVGDFLNNHAGPQGIRHKTSGGWRWAEPPESFHALPEKADATRKPLTTNWGYTPVDPSKL